MVSCRVVWVARLPFLDATALQLEHLLVSGDRAKHMLRSTWYTAHDIPAFILNLLSMAVAKCCYDTR